MTTSTPIIQIKGLHKAFPTGFFRTRKVAVKDLSLEVFDGEIFGFLGPNGAGKTTTIKALMGLIFPTSGEARLFGHPRAIRPARIERLLELVDMTEARDRPLRKLSKGMLQRIGIAQALINDPELVILDEPMSGLDPIGRKEVRDIIFRLKEQGKTVFFSSHILQDVEMICDRVAILDKGRLRKIGPLAELLSEQKGREVELTVSGVPEMARKQLESLATRVVVPGERPTVILPKERLDEILKLVVHEGGRIESLVPLKASLEDLFVQEVRQQVED